VKQGRSARAQGGHRPGSREGAGGEGCARETGFLRHRGWGREEERGPSGVGNGGMGSAAASRSSSAVLPGPSASACSLPSLLLRLPSFALLLIFLLLHRTAHGVQGYMHFSDGSQEDRLQCVVEFLLW